MKTPQRSKTATTATQSLREQAPQWWRAWDHDRITLACQGVPAASLQDHPVVAQWRGIAAFMNEGPDAQQCLELAWQGHTAQGDGPAAQVVARTALVLSLLDTGAMGPVDTWQARATGLAEAAPPDTPGPLDALWLRLGLVAGVALGGGDSAPAAQAVQALDAELRSVAPTLSPDERLLVALALIEYRFAMQRFEQFDLLANAVEAPPWFEAASALLRARWCFMHGYAHYQAGEHALAESTWQRAVQIADAGGTRTVQVQATLALVRLLLDRGRVDEADAVLETVRPQWGAGRTAQLIHLQQTRARVQLLRGQGARALATLQDALRLAEDAGVPAPERASLHTDQAQCQIALGNADAAAALLQRLLLEHSGRDAVVYRCLDALLRAWQTHATQPEQSRPALAEALALAQQTRYTMFFRLLPALAASLCALALRWGLQPVFVVEVVRARALPAPADADSRWPWPLWLRLIGAFELHHDGAEQPASGKTQHKPLELLRLLACERTLAQGNGVLARALWPEADDDAAQRSLDVAIHRLRKLLGDGSLLWVRDGRVGLDATRASSDVRQRRVLIERIEALAMRHGLAGEREGAGAAECQALVEQVLALSHGGLLPDAPAAAWLEAERQRCRRDTVRAALAAATVLERSQVSGPERELLEAALRVEPLAEALVLRLMRAYQRGGQRGDALRAFEAYRRQLADHGVAPGPQAMAQWRGLLAGG